MKHLARRSFLKASALTAATFGAPNLLLRAQDPKKPVIGEGAFKFECDHEWAQLPADHGWGGASHGVAFDSEGLVYISHQGGPGSVFVFEPSGKFIRSMIPQHQGKGHGIDIRREGDQDFIYLSPNNGLLCGKFTLKGECVWEGGKPPESHRYDKKEAYNATNISFCPDGGWHVGDGYGSSFIHRYDKNGAYVTSFGGAGTGPGQFKTPHGHWLDDRDGVPKLAVCDRANNRLQFMTLGGQHLHTVPDIDGPASLDIRGDIMLCTEVFIGRIAFLDASNNVVARLNDDAAWIKKIKETPNFRAQRDQWLPGKFIHPHDATFDKDGNIIVAEWVHGGRVTKLRKVA